MWITVVLDITTRSIPRQDIQTIVVGDFTDHVNFAHGKISNILARVTLKLDEWQTIEYILYAPQSFVHHFIAICGFKLSITRKRSNLGKQFFTFVNLTCDLSWPLEITFVNQW